MATPVYYVQGTPVVIPQQQQPPQNLSTVKRLAVTQLVIGILCVIFGIAVRTSTYWDAPVVRIGAGIWAGGWIVITGIVGVCTTRNYSNASLKGVYLAFSILSTCASGLAAIFFIVDIVFYSRARRCRRLERAYGFDCDYIEVGLGLSIPVLLLVVVEFFVSIFAAAYSCQYCCGVNQSTMVHPAGGVIIQQQYPGQMMPQYAASPQYVGQVLPQYSGHVVSQYNGQMVQIHAGQHVPTQAQYPMQTNVSSDKPPEYNASPN